MWLDFVVRFVVWCINVVLSVKKFTSIERSRCVIKFLLDFSLLKQMCLLSFSFSFFFSTGDDEANYAQQQQQQQQQQSSNSLASSILPSFVSMASSTTTSAVQAPNSNSNSIIKEIKENEWHYSQSWITNSRVFDSTFFIFVEQKTFFMLAF